MKLLKLILLFLSIIAFSCKKCGTCQFEQRTTINQTNPSYPMVTNIEQEACGDDYKEMKKATTTKSTTNSGGLIITTTITKKSCQDN